MQEGTRLLQRKPTLRRVGFIFFSIAIFLGIVIILTRAIPDLESTMYGFIKYGYPRLTSLSCPMLMTPLDREPVSIRLHNSLDRTLGYYVNAQFSSVPVIAIVEQHVDLQPKETKNLSWEVGQENIDLGNFILARVFTSAATSSGMREATCGTFVLNLPITGGPVIFYTVLVLSILGAGLGFWLWYRHSDRSDPNAASQFGWMRLITVVVAIGIVTGLLNYWFVALIMVFLTLLSVFVYLIPRKV